ncbi:MAG: class II glutamine amidotransferase [Sciscionella sp.]
MCRLVGWISRTPVTLEQVLGRAAVDRFVHLSNVHADGWGAAWYDEHGVMRVRRSVAAARTDRRFTDFAHGAATRAAFVHLRLGTPGYGHGLLSNHPFVDEPWALAHNGAILPGDRVDLLMSEHSSRSPRGASDSERYFLAMRDELDHNGRSVPRAVDHVVARMGEVGIDASSLNAMLLGPDALHIVSWHDAQWQATTIPVWPADDLASGAVLPPYFPMAYRETEDLVAAASSGIVSDADGWAPIPNHAVLSVDLCTGAIIITPVPR